MTSCAYPGGFTTFGQGIGKSGKQAYKSAVNEALRTGHMICIFGTCDSAGSGCNYTGTFEMAEIVGDILDMGHGRVMVTVKIDANCACN
jgi:hypothetical protein